MSVRVKLALSYAGFLTFAGVLLLAVCWFFLLRQRSSLYLPSARDFLLILDPSNFGPRIFSPAAIAALVLLIIIGLVGGWILAGRMLAPLDRITRAVRQVSRGSLSHRIDLEGSNDEFHELADAFDGMLARLEARVAEQQRFAANASHELRTPLAVMQAMLDVASQEDGADGRIATLRSVNARAIALTEALLLLSRADQRSFVHEPVDLSLLAEEAVETLLPLAEKNGVEVSASCEIAECLGSPTLLLHVVINLLQNAIVHNATPPGRVRIATCAESTGVTLTVANDGEHLSPELVAVITEPFHRGSQRVRRCDDAGVGLGLAIVASIVRAHEGTLSLAPRAEGGLLATVRLPRT